MDFKPIDSKDIPKAIDLLKYWKLPYADLQDSNVSLYSVYDKLRFLGIGGLEVYGQIALLRSLAVLPEITNQGIGRIICAHLEEEAKRIGISELYLLTTTTESFFNQHSYQKIVREAMPDVIKNTSEFSELCPDSAVCMKKCI